MNLIPVTIISTSVDKNPLEEIRVSLMVNKRVWNPVFDCNLKNNRMISDHFEGK